MSTPIALPDGPGASARERSRNRSGYDRPDAPDRHRRYHRVRREGTASDSADAAFDACSFESLVAEFRRRPSSTTGMRAKCGRSDVMQVSFKLPRVLTMDHFTLDLGPIGRRDGTI